MNGRTRGKRALNLLLTCGFGLLCIVLGNYPVFAVSPQVDNKNQSFWVEWKVADVDNKMIEWRCGWQASDQGEGSHVGFLWFEPGGPVPTPNGTQLGSGTRLLTINPTSNALQQTDPYSLPVSGSYPVELQIQDPYGNDVEYHDGSFTLNWADPPGPTDGDGGWVLPQWTPSDRNVTDPCTGSGCDTGTGTGGGVDHFPTSAPPPGPDPGTNQGCNAGSGYPLFTLPVNPFQWPLYLLSHLAHVAIWLVIPQTCVIDNFKTSTTAVFTGFPFDVVDQITTLGLHPSNCMHLGDGGPFGVGAYPFKVDMITPNDVYENCHASFVGGAHMETNANWDGMTHLQRLKMRTLAREQRMRDAGVVSPPTFAGIWPTTLDFTAYGDAILAARMMVKILLWVSFFVRLWKMVKGMVGIDDGGSEGGGNAEDAGARSINSPGGSPEFQAWRKRSQGK